MAKRIRAFNMLLKRRRTKKNAKMNGIEQKGYRTAANSKWTTNV